MIGEDVKNSSDSIRGKNVYNSKGECCGNHLSQEQMITQEVNLLVEVSSGEFTRELDKESLLN